MEPVECLFLNAIIVFLICIGYFLYNVIFHDHKIETTIRRYATMSQMQVAFAIWVAIATVMTSMVVLTMDKHYNTPLINNMLFKVVSVVLLVLTGVILFNESYNFSQLTGICLVVFGGSLLFYHSDDSLKFKKEHTLF
jgi:multidrug transporter EmrE-like cation transporter